MHICGLLEVILHDSASALFLLAEVVVVLLLGCCLPTAFSKSPDVLACLLVARSYSGDYTDKQLTFLPHLALMCHPG